ncbi:MAG TPA: hypothetical protein VGB20_00795 [bacterium]
MAMSLIRWLGECADRLLEWHASWKPARLRLLPVLGLFLLALCLRQFADLDLFARIALGRLIWRDGGVPLEDPFAYTPTKPVWYDHEWGAGFIFYGLARLGGDVALFAASFALACAAIAVVYAALRELAGDRPAGVVWLGLGLLPCFIVWEPVIRSRVFTFLCFAVFLLVFARLRVRGRTRLLWLLPAVTAAWANLHAGFVVGLMSLGVVAAWHVFERGRRAWPAALCLLACVPATLINPYGAAFWRFVFEGVTKARVQILEWQPTDPLSPRGLFLLATAAVLLLGWLRNRKSIPPEGLILLAGSFIEAWKHFRLGPLFHWTAIVYGAGAFMTALDWARQALPERVVELGRRVLTLAAAVGAVLGVYVGAWVLVQAESFTLSRHILPVEAMAWLRVNRSGGRMLVHFGEGSYALWQGHPEFLVSMDGRYEAVYPDEVVEDVYRAFHPDTPDLPGRVDEIGADFMLLCEYYGDRPPPEAYGSAWRVIYRDEECAILGREPNPGGAIGAPLPGRKEIWTPHF